MNDVVHQHPRQVSLPESRKRELRRLNELAKSYVSNLRGNTKRAYVSDYRDWVDWCTDNHIDHEQATVQDLMLYISKLADASEKEEVNGTTFRTYAFAMSTLKRRLAGIDAIRSMLHLQPLADSVEIKKLIAGIDNDRMNRTKGANREHEVKKPGQGHEAVSLDLFYDVFNGTPTDSLAGLRDRAILSWLFFGAFRRSELVGISLGYENPQSGQIEGSHITADPNGLLVKIEDRKQDRAGQQEKGFYVPIGSGTTEACPVRCYSEWVTAAEISTGALFRRVFKGGSVGEAALNAGSVRTIVRRAFLRVGADPDLYSPHSFRAGFITECINRDIQPLKIVSVTGQSVSTLNRYYKPKNMIDSYPLKGLF